MTFAVQFLEPSPETLALSAPQAASRLSAAMSILPVERVIIGWDLPEHLIAACAGEASRARSSLFLWHPLLTFSASSLPPRADWQTLGPSGDPIPGFAGMPEFTFMCPNRPEVFEAVLARLQKAIHSGPFQGIFLDRIRWPSPTADPSRLMACFCPACQRAAIAQGIDLAGVRHLLAAPRNRAELARFLLNPASAGDSASDWPFLRRLMDFRARSITRLVRAAAELIRAHGLGVGLDCFSPSLTSLVGQELAALDAYCDWIKFMVYGHTYAPAGLPFELLNLQKWVNPAPLDSNGLPSDVLESTGLPPAFLANEIRAACACGIKNAWAGIELVDLPGVTRLNDAQIQSDLRAFRAANPAGLVLSWDLRHISDARLQLVADNFCPGNV
ncbi:MAG: hypothetical protein EHM81_01810 [Chloroflexi bacterium]|nr:MAG: hypothetical protein EHM81_01810 [Chloroflexota bacterium]